MSVPAKVVAGLAAVSRTAPVVFHMPIKVARRAIFFDAIVTFRM